MISENLWLSHGFANGESGASCKLLDCKARVRPPSALQSLTHHERDSRYDSIRVVLEGRRSEDGDVGVHLLYKRDSYSNMMQRLAHQVTDCCNKEQISAVNFP